MNHNHDYDNQRERSTMEESSISDRTSSVMSSSGGMNNKMTSDSGYGSNSNKSHNSQSQRSSGSTESQKSSLSSGSCSFLSHPSTTTPNVEQHGQGSSGAQPSSSSVGKPRQEKEHKRKKKSSKGKTMTGSGGESGQRLSCTPMDTMTGPGTKSGTKSSNVPVTSESGINSSNNNTISNSNANVTSSSVPLSSNKGASSSTGDISQQASPDGRLANDSKALQMAALTHALSCIKKFRDQDLDLIEESEDDKMSNEFFWNEYFESMREELSISSENGFGAVVSMEDGLVVHITKELSQILGYPKDMWLGRSFMDLVHPKDKMAFASQFTSSNGISFPTQEGTSTPNKGPAKPSKEEFFCRLRQYRGLKTTGYGVADKAVVFFPFSLTLKLREVDGIQKIKRNNGDEVENVDKKSVYLFIGANRVTSAYQYPEEVPQNPDKFVTRHSATCQFGHIDPAAVSYLGHLPQDVVGNSVLDYYHPDDMILLRDIYEGVMNERGKPFKSKPYRFRVYNGTFAMLETDWSCFINPWSWKLEFVIGQHTVLKGPLNPNVFMAPPSNPSTPEEGEGKVVQDEIKKLLAETVSRRISDPLKQRSSRRKKDLAVLLETLLDQIGNETSDPSDSVASGALSCLGRDSAMLGEISPHHDDHSVSNQSSETPPSYNQLNYRENIERFFLSHPKTTRESDESTGDAGPAPRPCGGNDAPQMSTDEESKGSRNESSDSANRQSSGSFGENNDTSEGQGAGVNDDGENFPLTVDVLYRHNENMEKRMVQRHREIRGKNPSSLSASASNKNARTKDMGGKSNNLKRSGRELAGWTSTGSSRKAHKQPHMEIPTNYTESCQPHPSASSVNLWPPFSVGVTEPSPTPTFAASMLQPRVPREGEITGLPTFMQTQSAATTTTGGLQNINQLQTPYLYVHNQQQFFQQSVPYAYPSNVIYQPFGQTIYGQPTAVPASVETVGLPNANVFGASQSILMNPRLHLNPSAQPGVPIIQASPQQQPQLHPGYAGHLRGLGIGQIPIPNLSTIQGHGASVAAVAAAAARIAHLVPTSVPGIPIVQSPPNIQLAAVSSSSSPISISLHSTSTSTSTSTISTSSSSSSIPISSCFFPTRLNTTTTTASAFNSNHIMNNNSNVNSRRLVGKEHLPPHSQQQQQSTRNHGHHHNQNHHHHHHHHHGPQHVHNHTIYGNANHNYHHKDRPTELQLWKMAKERLEMTKRGIPLKAAADFSSSDGFGESSSGSLYSLLKNDKSSDDSLNSSNSREDKDSLERFNSDLFPSNNSDGDQDNQDMLWENHVDKEQDLQMIARNGKRRNRAKRNRKAPWLQDVEMTPDLSFRYQIESSDMSDILQKDLARLKIMGKQPQLVDEQLGELTKELQVGGRSRSNSLNLNEGSSKYGSSFGSDDEDENDDDKDNNQNPEKEETEVHYENDGNKEILDILNQKGGEEEKNKNEKVEKTTVQSLEQNFNHKKDKTKKSKKNMSASDYDKIVQTYEENAPFPKPIYTTPCGN